MPLQPQQQPPYYTPSNNNSKSNYIGLISQTSTNPPTVIELENTIGPIIWTYIAPGQYRATLTNAFTENKTWTNIVNNAGETTLEMTLFWTDQNTLDLETEFVTTKEDGWLDITPIEIRVYQ